MQRAGLGFLKVFEDHRRLEDDVVAGLEQRYLAEPGYGGEPVRLGGKIDGNSLEGDLFLGQGDGVDDEDKNTDRAEQEVTEGVDRKFNLEHHQVDQCPAGGYLRFGTFGIFEKHIRVPFSEPGYLRTLRSFPPVACY